MAGSIKIRAREQNGVIDVKALLEHPMETGAQKDETGAPIPIHFITEVTVEHNGQRVLSADWGTGIARNPYLAFRFQGGHKGDTIQISWIDNRGDAATAEATVG